MAPWNLGPAHTDADIVANKLFPVFGPLHHIRYFKSLKLIYLQTPSKVQISKDVYPCEQVKQSV